jgi:hypothetical protein
MSKASEVVESLLTKAADTGSPEGAMKYTQAALNAANAACALKEAERKPD